MAIWNKTAKMKKPSVAKSPAKKWTCALAEASRRRRQRVLKPVNRDPFLAMISSRKTASRREFIRQCTPCISSVPCDLESEVEVEAKANCSTSGQSTHEYLIDIGGGVMSNVLLAQRLPEKLQRPDLLESAPDDITQAGHDSELALRELEMARKELIRNGEQLYSVVANAVAESPIAIHTSELPKFIAMRVPENIRPEYLPSHMLAVYSNNPDLKKRKISLAPIHASIFAAHCSRVPRLPTPRPPSPSFGRLDGQTQYQRRVVPLIPFAIPSEDTFPVMQQFLYTQDTARLFRTLVPIGPSSGGMWDGDFSRLSEVLAQTYTSASLVSRALFVYRVWQNACSLGVLNPCLWQVIDVAWKAHRDAILLGRR